MIIGLSKDIIEKNKIETVNKKSDMDLVIISKDLDYCYLETVNNFKFLFTLEDGKELFDLVKFKELINEFLINSGLNQKVVSDYIEGITKLEYTESKLDLIVDDLIKQEELINPFKEVQSQIMSKYNDIYNLNLDCKGLDLVSTRAYDIQVKYLGQKIFMTVPFFYSLADFIELLNQELAIDLKHDESEYDYLGFSKYTLLLDEVFDYKLAIKKLYYKVNRIEVELLDVRYDYKFLKYKIISESDLKS